MVGVGLTWCCIHAEVEFLAWLDKVRARVACVVGGVRMTGCCIQGGEAWALGVGMTWCCIHSEGAGVQG
jgi:hypothetical protein